MTKTLTLRLAAEKAAELEAVAKADEMHVSEAVREAIDRHIQDRRTDKEFQSRLQRLIREEQGVLKRLAST
ncbi:MAG: hypothetical protein AABM42_12435 [Actinomycetota bacterium]